MITIVHLGHAPHSRTARRRVIGIVRFRPDAVRAGPDGREDAKPQVSKLIRAIAAVLGLS
ncbi:hypothetical protein [Actinomadura sp. B10D3]|uniref:hypothetical protein n=1 Tax=Actinomadura sp. B10D3 TaxID=3153557 RepID=UPI00325D821C